LAMTALLGGGCIRRAAWVADRRHPLAAALDLPREPAKSQCARPSAWPSRLRGYIMVTRRQIYSWHVARSPK
jgi:hypothetical protein